MSRRRMVAAAGAALVAAVGVWVLAGGSGGGGDGAAAGAVSIVRVARDIERGTPAEQALADGALEVVEVPATDPSVAAGVGPASLPGTVAVTAVVAGGPLPAGAFAPPAGPGADLRGRLPSAGHTALAITVDATRAVGGWLRPGDRVNLLVPGQCADELGAQAAAAATGGEVRCRRARYLYQAVDVLAVGGALGPGGDAVATAPTTGPLTVVLSLPPRAAQWVATWENDLTLALVPPDYVPRIVEPLPTVVDRLPGEQAPTLQPGCTDPAAPGPEGETQACPGLPAP